MSFNITENVYGITESGRKVKIGTVTTPDPDVHRVAGKIFYIDDNASGASYTFYDENGDEIQNVSVGDEPYAYKVNGTPSADKYYIVHQTAISGKWRPGTSNEKVPLVTSDLTGAIGTGKLCSAEAESALDGALVQSSETVWYAINQINNAVGAAASDWYIPSKEELKELYDSGVLTDFISALTAWTSTEKEYLTSGTTNTCWAIKGGNYDHYFTYNGYTTYAIRSF